MKFSEWDFNNDLFEHILGSDPFTQAFTSDQIQHIFNLRYSQREVNLYLAFKGTHEVASMVNVLYLDKWKLSHNHLTNREDLDVGATKRITETVLTNELNSNENTNAEKETTYNSAELSDVSGSAGSSKDEKEATVTRTYEEVNSNVRNVDSRLKLMGLIDIIVSDVAGLLLLSIY